MKLVRCNFLFIMMRLYTITLILGTFSLAPAAAADPKIITRAGWGAQPPDPLNKMPEPTPYVTLHHTYIPGYCSTTDACKAAMRSMQNYHKNELKWGDIGYSFCIGGDGNIYEGRGWGVEGAHTYGWNRRSIGICLIGDFRTASPPQKMLARITELSDWGAKTGHLKKDFKYVAHKQVGQTECPGDAFYKYIRTLPNWAKDPK